jgi:hypothetical protein
MHVKFTRKIVLGRNYLKNERQRNNTYIY